MKDIRLEKMAKILVYYSLELKKGDKFLITGSDLSKNLILEVYKEALKVGAYPEVQIGIEELKEILLKQGNDEQLEYISPVIELTTKEYDAELTLWGGYNAKYLSNVDSKKLSKRSAAMMEINEIFMNRIANGEIKWCGTQFPTQSDAQEASMSLSEYEEFLFNSCKLNSDDPIAEWKKVHDEQQKLVEYLNTKKTIHFKSEDTNLKMNIEGRKWINCDGKENFPDGEVFTSPIKETLEGTVRFSYPAIYNGKEVEDVRLIFEKGKVIKATAAKGQEFLLAILDTDEGSRYAGEIAIGTNYDIEKFTKNILFDEKIGGTIHLALGAAMPEAGGKNVSGIHWDMICDMKNGGEIYADGELFYRDGKVIIDL